MQMKALVVRRSIESLLPSLLSPPLVQDDLEFPSEYQR